MLGLISWLCYGMVFSISCLWVLYVKVVCLWGEGSFKFSLGRLFAFSGWGFWRRRRPDGLLGTAGHGTPASARVEVNCGDRSEWRGFSLRVNCGCRFGSD